MTVAQGVLLAAWYWCRCSSGMCARRATPGRQRRRLHAGVSVLGLCAGWDRLHRTLGRQSRRHPAGHLHDRERASSPPRTQTQAPRTHGTADPDPDRTSTTRPRGPGPGVGGCADRGLFVPPSRVASAPTIMMFDSGLGGLTVYREVTQARPDARYIYVADDAFFPYGRHREDALVERVVALMGDAAGDLPPRTGGHRLQHRLDTGAAASARPLRGAFRRHRAGDQAGLRGLDDANACRCSAPRRRYAREYTRALIRDFANGADVTLVGSARLASLRGGRAQRHAGRGCRDRG